MLIYHPLICQILTLFCRKGGGKGERGKVLPVGVVLLASLAYNIIGLAVGQVGGRICIPLTMQVLLLLSRSNRFVGGQVKLGSYSWLIELEERKKFANVKAANLEAVVAQVKQTSALCQNHQPELAGSLVINLSRLTLASGAVS